MQVGGNPNVKPGSSTSDPGDSGSPFQLSAKVIDKIDKLADWRIDHRSIYFPKTGPQVHGGHATVSRGVLVSESNNGSNINLSENAGAGQGPCCNAPRGKAVAVKSMKINNEDDRERVLLLALREAGFLVELSHQNIVKFEGFAEDLSKNRVWLIFPWEENGNLKDFVASQDWEIPERIWLIDDVARGVGYLHGQSPPIHHGDLKSVNVLVTSECRAVITDFGSARRLAPKSLDPQVRQAQTGAKPELEFQATFCAETNTMTLTGNGYTLRWAAPELLLDEEPGLWSDIWALGWIFYEVMTNSIPFQNVRKESLIIKQVIQGNLPPVNDHARMSLILRLSSLMIKCWSINPRERPTAEDCERSLDWMPMVAPDPQRASRTGDSGGRSPQLLMELAFMHKQQDDYMSASKLLNEALDLFTHAGDNLGRAEALSDLAEVHYLRDEHTEALRLYSEALEILTKMEDRRGRARALRGLAMVHRDQEEYSKAVTFYDDAADISTDIGDRQGKAYALYGLAEMHRLQDQNIKALALYFEVVEICTELGDRSRTADVLCGLAEVYRNLNDYTGAATLYSRAQSIYTDLGDRLGMANALLCLAHTRVGQDHLVDAVRLYEEAAQIFEQIGNTSKLTRARGCAASVRMELELLEAE